MLMPDNVATLAIVASHDVCSSVRLVLGMSGRIRSAAAGGSLYGAVEAPAFASREISHG